MPSYTHNVRATTDGTPGTEQAFTELNPANDILVKRVEISMETPASDARLIARLLRTSATGTGTPVAGTSVNKDPGMRATGLAILEKNAAVAFTPGAVTDIFKVVNVNGRAIYTWVPRGNEEYYRVEAASFFVVALACDIASLLATVETEWED